MGLSEIVSGSGTTGFAQVGFIISFASFALIVVWALLRPKALLLAEARKALSDGQLDERSENGEECSNGKQ